MHDLCKILKYVPSGITLYSEHHRKNVVFNKVDECKAYPIICKTKTNCGDDVETTFNSIGEYYSCEGIVLFPEKSVYWDEWQLSIFPKCIGSIITDNGFELYKIVSKTAITTYGIENIESIPMSSIDLSQFRFAIPNEIKLYHEPPVQKSIFKPFDKVLVRDKGGMWHCMFFSHQKNNYYFAGGKYWYECVPYNKYTDYLIGSSESFDIDTIRKNKK